MSSNDNCVATAVTLHRPAFDWPVLHDAATTPCPCCPDVFGTSLADPMHPATFSGVSFHLFTALQQMGKLAGAQRAADISRLDFFRGTLPRPFPVRHLFRTLRTRWLWKHSTVAKLSRQFHAKMATRPAPQAILHVGTHVLPDGRSPMFLFTDATVAQCANADEFQFGAGWSDAALHEAIEVQQEIFQASRLILVPSHWAQQSVVQDYGIEPGRVKVVGEGVAALGSLSRRPLPKSPNILFIGYDWERKNGPLLVEAFRQVRQAFPQAELTIIGCQPAVDVPGVRVLGQLRKNHPQEREVFQQALQEAWVLCVPSRFEPYGLCFLEAQMYGIPPVTFAGEGRAEVLLDGVTGKLVPRRTAEALASAIVELFHEPPLLASMGRQGRQFVQAHFTWRAAAGRMLAHICESLQESP